MSEEPKETAPTELKSTLPPKQKGKKLTATQVRQQGSFIDQVNKVAEAVVVQRVEPSIERGFKILEHRLNKNVEHTLTHYLLKISVLESILIEKLGETEGSIDARLLSEEDRIEGYSEVHDETKQGDFVRIAIKDKAEEKSDSMLLKIKSLGNEQGLDKAIQEGIYGMKTGETRDISVKLNDADFTFTVRLNRVSRKKEEPKNEVSEEVGSEVAAPLSGSGN
jgi:hypothetical protein